MINRIIFLIITALIISSCASVPGVKEPSDAEINAQSAKAYEEVKAKSKISNNKEWTALVQRVAKRIEIASGEPFQWEAVLIESNEINAWCMPGGKIAVYTGIMPVLKTEAALAAVMGHEVAHATLRHGKQQYARAMQEKYGGLILGGAIAIGGQLLCKTELCKKASLLGGAASGFLMTFLDRKFSRGDETDADKQGQIFMAKAGYDPSEAPRLWLRMAEAMGGKAPAEWMSTHPSDERRRENLNLWMSDANSYYSKAPQKYGLGEAIK